MGRATSLTLVEVADDLSRRLISLFLNGPRRAPACARRQPPAAGRPRWRDLIWFHEYFHGDTGAGLGASHQTGWTGLVVHLIAGRSLSTDMR